MSQKKRIVITGGGSGLGRALALVYARKGWRVCIADMDPRTLEETGRLIDERGGEALTRQCDVTAQGAFKELAQTVEECWGGLDVLVNNAGVGAAGTLDAIPEDRWEWIMDVNLKAVIRGCRRFTPLMEAQGSGHIVNVASSAGIVSFPEMSSYNVTKAGVISLSETLYSELASKGIGVTVAAPTFFKTNLMERFHSTDDQQRKVAEGFFAKTRYTAEDVARDIEKAVRRKRLYVIPQWDGKVMWWMKRLSPELFHRGMAVFTKKRGFERMFC
ncbi:SDR family oxidoreductase [Desulfoluna butyratoxydans]|uniref:Short-chain dehydrogenase/reductase sdr n=1 Tax=Desulfoluna butyratoxydans TaxID=231438 RepID=A0A4V6ILG0_9BACT|nr:SDR family oxidoreductase [Desulfoluna butyratoxydans]VFQ44968.1 short-chain dehydrogenase/reductase sdr [Desulfoluna butyratoxydans]